MSAPAVRGFNPAWPAGEQEAWRLGYGAALAAQPVQQPAAVSQLQAVDINAVCVLARHYGNSETFRPQLLELLEVAQPAQRAEVVGQEPIGYAPTYLTERLDAGDSAVMLTVTRKPLPGHGVTVALYTAPVPAAGVQGDDLIGMSVSVDVSTGDDDAGNRLFGTIEGVQQYDGAKHGLMLLITDPKPNFTVPDSGRDAALVQAVLVLDKAIHQVLIAGGDYGDELSDADLREKLKQAQLAAYPALIAAGVEKAEYSVNPFSVFIDHAAAHPANGAQTDLVAKINALRVRGVNYEDGVPARQLVDRAEVLALLGGAS